MIQIEALRNWYTRSHVKYGVSSIWIIVVMAFLLMYLSKNYARISQSQWDLNIYWLFLAFIMAMFRRLAAAFRWALILNYGETHALFPSTISCFKPFFYSNLANYIPGSIWAIASRIELTRQQGIPIKQSAFSIAYELGLNLVLGLAIGSYALLKLTSLNNSSVALISVSIVLLTTLLIYPKIWKVLFSFLSRMLDLDISRIVVYPTKNLVLWLVSISTWLLGGISLFCLVKAVYVVFPWSLFTLLVSASAVGWTAGFLAIWTPSGLGVREGVTVGLLLNIIPELILVAVVIADRLLMLLVDLIWAGIFTLRSGSFEDFKK